MEFIMLLFLIPAAMFTRWGFVEGDPECFVLATIYAVGAIGGSIFLLLVGAR